MGYLQLDAKDFIDAQTLGNRPHQVRAGRRNHQNPVTCLAVCGDGSRRVTENDRFDKIFHPRPDQMIDLFRCPSDQRLKAEGHVVLHRQVPLAIGVHQLPVATQEGFAIDPAKAGHLLAPQ
ncbi:hypothetical protein D3C78_1535850 [compost metagenome]